MELEEARDLLRRFQRERNDAREALQEAQLTIESSQLIIDGITKRFPQLADEEKEWGNLWGLESSERPRGAEAILSVLQVEENQWYSIAELVKLLDQQDLLPESANPANAVRAAVERLVASPGSNVEKAKRSGTGTVIYRYTEPEPVYAPPYRGEHEEEEPF